MIKIERATEIKAEVLALLARVTYIESHGHFIDDKSDLEKYLNDAFSVSKILEEINHSNYFFFLIYVDDLPVGYSKLILNAKNESVNINKNCRLDKIYILNDFIPLKIGQQLFKFTEDKAKELGLETLWLCVYIKNNRGIRFYEKNGFKNIGTMDFRVNGKPYENILFEKYLQL